MAAYADSPGVTSGVGNVPYRPGGSGWNPTGSTWNDWGVRVTFTTASPIGEEGIPKLSGNYTADDLSKQRTDIMNINKTRYWESGDFGIYYWGNRRSLNDIRPGYGVASSMDTFELGSTLQTMQYGSVTDKSNLLAYMCWEGFEDETQWPESTRFVQELYDIVVGAGTQYANGDDWLYDIKQKYLGAGGKADYQDRLRSMISDGSNTASNLRAYTWDTVNYQDASAQLKAKWSFIGYITTLIQFAWVAQDTGNQNTYEAMRDMLYSYYVSGYDAELMPILMIETCSSVSVNGGPEPISPSNVMLATLPYQLNEEYGTDSSPLFFSQWPDGVNTTQGAVQYVAGTKTLASGGPGRLAQGLGYVYDAGRPVRKYEDRAFYTLFSPIDSNEKNVYGYIIGYTYYVDNPTGEPHTPDSTGSKGSFTWDLTPKGVIDKTPDKEVNASSTIYNWNISQDRYNNNNYKEWETWVRSDDTDCNKIRFNIYHVAESLPKDSKSTVYTRGQVKSAGKKVTEPLDRVTPGAEGYIEGFPLGFTRRAKNV